MSQLRTHTWPSKEAAVKELKRNGFKERGADYQIGETSEGSNVWHLCDLADDVSQEPPAETPKPTKAKPKAAKPEHPADADDKAKAAMATGYSVHFRASPTKTFSEDAATLDEARTIRDRMNAEHGKHGRRAMIYALQAEGPPVPVSDDATETKAPERVAKGIKRSPQKKAADAAKGKANGTGKGTTTPEAAPEPDTPAEAPVPENDLSPPPAKDGPYTLQIADQVAQHDIAKTALSWSQKIGFRVAIIDKAGKAVRVIDGRLGGKRPTRTAVRREGAASRGPKGEGKQAKAIALLSRDKGATAAELNGVTGWPIAQRHINRLAKVSGKKIKALGDKKWALI
jgi:hypothetical protein